MKYAPTIHGLVGGLFGLMLSAVGFPITTWQFWALFLIFLIYGNMPDMSED